MMDAHEERSLRDTMNTMYAGMMEAIVSVRDAAELSSTRLEAKIDSQVGRLRNEIGGLHNEVGGLRNEMIRRFDRVDDRFDQVEARLERLEAKPKRPKNRD